MLVAGVMLFYVSYWLLSKMEVAKWNRFVKGKVQEALSSGSALALVSVAFLAVYREGFETMLFYKALFVAAGAGSGVMPVVGGIAAGSVVLVVAYLAINDSASGCRSSRSSGSPAPSSTTWPSSSRARGSPSCRKAAWSARRSCPGRRGFPALGIYPTVESLALQGVLLLLFVIRPGLDLRDRAPPPGGDTGAGPGVGRLGRRRARPVTPCRYSMVKLTCCGRSSGWMPTWPRCGRRSSGSSGKLGAERR